MANGMPFGTARSHSRLNPPSAASYLKRLSAAVRWARPGAGPRAGADAPAASSGEAAGIAMRVAVLRTPPPSLLAAGHEGHGLRDPWERPHASTGSVWIVSEVAPAMSGAEALWGGESMANMGNNPLMNSGGPASRHRSRLRDADRRPIRRDAAGRHAHIRVRPGLPDRLRHAGSRAGEAEPGVRRRRRTAREPTVPGAGAGRRNRPARPRAGYRPVGAGPGERAQ